ncbi:MAG: hypothetical protein KDB90_07845 [Planctomycetes bacterium]|nr:hypothetical protein [Planctomycetota bacterium]
MSGIGAGFSQSRHEHLVRPGAGDAIDAKRSTKQWALATRHSIQVDSTAMESDSIKDVTEAEGLAKLGVASVVEAAKHYKQRISQAPPLHNNQMPRRISDSAKLGACGGNFFGWVGSAWLSIALMMLVLAAAGETEELGLLIVFLAFFVVMGLIILSIAFKRGLRSIRIVRNGLLTWAVVTDVETKIERSTGGRTPNTIEYHVSFIYHNYERLFFAKANVSRHQPITDQATELLLFSQDDPEHVEFADLLPGGLRIDTTGRVHESGFHTLLGLVPFLMIPAGPIVGAILMGMN